MTPQITLGLATLTGALGMWLMLPRGNASGRMLGVVFALASLGLFGSQVPFMEDWVSQGVFYVLAGVTLISAAATVTFRNPVYCAIWFALSLLGTAGLYLFQGSQFLGVATVVVYAGAILVTFLFVLMLAQPQGHAYYDRLSWEALLSACTGAVMVGVLTLTISTVFQRPPRPTNPGSRLDGVLASEHVATLGGELFSRYLIGVEVAGTLLLVALVGAVAIVSHARSAERKAAGETQGRAMP